jgi:hypothetical protein
MSLHRRLTIIWEYLAKRQPETCRTRSIVCAAELLVFHLEWNIYIFLAQGIPNKMSSTYRAQYKS